jgi:uncharacterized protein involved in oxidation of intracellular sulfur
MIIYSSEPETVWNAMRLANCALMNKNSVEVFLLGKGVDIHAIDSKAFNIPELVSSFKSQGGKMMACSACVQGRNLSEYCLCETSKGMEWYQLIKECDKVLTF